MMHSMKGWFQLNSVQNLWEIIKKRLHGRQITNAKHLTIETIKAWSCFKNDTIIKNWLNQCPQWSIHC